MVYLAAYGYSNGNLSNIIQGIDQYTKVCGNSNYTSPGGTSYANYPYLYFTSPITTAALSYRVCVDACPSWNSATNTIAQVNCPTASDCAYQFTYSSTGAAYSGSGSPSANSIIGYDTTAMLGRVCIPNANMFTSLFAAVTSSFSSSLFQSQLNNFISDIKNVTSILFRTTSGCWLLPEPHCL